MSLRGPVPTLTNEAVGQVYGLDGWDGMGWDGMGWDGWMDGWMDGWVGKDLFLFCILHKNYSIYDANSFYSP